MSEEEEEIELYEEEERKYYERLDGFVTEILDFLEEQPGYTPKEYSSIVHVVVKLLRSYCPTKADCLDTLEVVRRQIKEV